MPFSRKRRSSRKASRRRFTKRVKSSSSSSASSTSFSPAKNLLFNAVKSHGPSILKFPLSYFCKQPMPDKFLTWMQTDIVGYIPSAGVATGSFGHSINQVWFPWNVSGGTGAVVPNPFINPNSVNPAGLRNIMYNSASGTGIYEYYRVWTTVVQYTFTPNSTGDAVMVAVAPVTTGAVFSNITQVGQATNSMIKVATAGVSSEANSLVGTYSIPQLLGVSKKDYEAVTYGVSYGASPVTTAVNNVWYQTTDENVFNARCGILITMKMHVEFFGRVDGPLLDN